MKLIQISLSRPPIVGFLGFNVLSKYSLNSSLQSFVVIGLFFREQITHNDFWCYSDRSAIASRGFEDFG